MPTPKQFDLFASPPDGEEPERTPETRSDIDPPRENYWDYCPNCGARLHNQGCKYRCPTCFYFMSCSDFD